MNAVVNTIVPVREYSTTDLPQLQSADLLRRLRITVQTIAHRAPSPADESRWVQHSIGGISHRIAQPVTFTPYAAAQPCSARCRFCSENLRDTRGARSSSALRPRQDYFTNLALALRELEGLPIGYSLSGLETTDDPHWMERMLDTLQQHASRSTVTERVLYTNGAGFADPVRRESTLTRFIGFDLDWSEVSRHHFDEHANQAIMRFRDGIAAREQDLFERSMRTLAARIPVKLVCIVQRTGIADADLVMRYLDWARELGVAAVIFREFSQLSDAYVMNNTARYVSQSRVPMIGLVQQVLDHATLGRGLAFHRATEGYYFWNLISHYREMDVTFEASDYARMHAMHDSGRIYKLVFHTNGNLCAGWNPERQVLLQPKST
jgi:hypothetical protein